MEKNKIEIPDINDLGLAFWSIEAAIYIDNLVLRGATDLSVIQKFGELLKNSVEDDSPYRHDPVAKKLLGEAVMETTKSSFIYVSDVFAWIKNIANTLIGVCPENNTEDLNLAGDFLSTLCKILTAEAWVNYKLTRFGRQSY
jgi:hypothetical protein